MLLTPQRLQKADKGSLQSAALKWDPTEGNRSLISSTDRFNWLSRNISESLDLGPLHRKDYKPDTLQWQDGLACYQSQLLSLCLLPQRLSLFHFLFSAQPLSGEWNGLPDPETEEHDTEPFPDRNIIYPWRGEKQAAIIPGKEMLFYWDRHVRVRAWTSWKARKSIEADLLHWWKIPFPSMLHLQQDSVKEPVWPAQEWGWKWGLSYQWS